MRIPAGSPRWRRWSKRIAFGTLLIGIFVYVMTIHRFLAVTKPVRAKVLIVEAWIWSRPAMREVSGEFQKGGYQCLICVGMSIPEARTGQPSAELAASRLVELGIPKEVICTLNVPDAQNDRTFGSAMAVSDWLRKQMPGITSVNVFTLGVHARKSQLLFRKALGSDFEVGVIAGTEDPDFVRGWWTTRHGIYLVLRNSAGWVYALIRPHPLPKQQ